MDIHFNCPWCDQKLSVEERGAGMIVNCPDCNRQIEIPPGPKDEPKYNDPLTNPDAPWRSDLATDAQKRKLRFYGVRFYDNLTKGDASNLIDDAMASHPEKEEKYQQWKQAEEEVAYWYLQAVMSDYVGDDMGMPTREMVQDTITLLNTAQPDWRQRISGYAFSRFLITRYPELQNNQAIEAARTDNSTVAKATDEWLRMQPR